MHKRIRHHAARWAVVAAGTMAVASPLAVAASPAHALGIPGIPKAKATCSVGNGMTVEEGTEVAAYQTVKTPDGGTLVVKTTFVCGSDGLWRQK